MRNYVNLKGVVGVEVNPTKQPSNFLMYRLFGFFQDDILVRVTIFNVQLFFTLVLLWKYIAVVSVA